MCDTCPDRDTIDAIARNPAAPVGVLTRLLCKEAVAAWDAMAWRALPDEVVDAIVAHPDHRLGSVFAANPSVTPEQRARLVDDPDARVREALAYGPDWFRIPWSPFPCPPRSGRSPTGKHGSAGAHTAHGSGSGRRARRPPGREPPEGSVPRLGPALRRQPGPPAPRFRPGRAPGSHDACREDAGYTDLLLDAELNPFDRQEVIRYGAHEHGDRRTAHGKAAKRRSGANWRPTSTCPSTSSAPWPATTRTASGCPYRYDPS